MKIGGKALPAQTWGVDFLNKVSSVVVTGMNACTLLGNDLNDFWNGLITGKDRSKAENPKNAAEYANACNNGSLTAKQILLRKQIISCIKQTLYEADISQELLINLRTVLVLCTFLGEIGCLKNEYISGLHPFDAIAKEVKLQLGINIPAIVLTNACASGTQGIGLGMDLIRQGKAELVIVCAYEAVDGFVSIGMDSIRSLGNKLRPFDAKREGTVLGEGIGVIILEGEKNAIARKSNIYAEILGCGMSNDAYHYLRPNPEATGMISAIKMALQDAGLSPEDIDYINAHGTGTLLNDSAETLAIKTVFGKLAPHIPISSIKGVIGHTLGASGVIAAIATILSIQKDCLPMTANYENPDPVCDLDYIQGQSRKQRTERALCHAFGFGGVNGVLALGRYPQLKKSNENNINEPIHIREGLAVTWTEINDEHQLLTKAYSLVREFIKRLDPEQWAPDTTAIVLDVSDGLFPSQIKFWEESAKMSRV